jgi:hypothetical protein
MAQADSVLSTPRTNTSAIDHHPMMFPPRDPTRRAMSADELTPKHVLVDLFGSGDFPVEILDPEHAAEIVIQRLNDAGFEIIPAERCRI